MTEAPECRLSKCFVFDFHPLNTVGVSNQLSHRLLLRAFIFPPTNIQQDTVEFKLLTYPGFGFDPAYTRLA